MSPVFFVFLSDRQRATHGTGGSVGAVPRFSLHVIVCMSKTCFPCKFYFCIFADTQRRASARKRACMSSVQRAVQNEDTCLATVRIRVSCVQQQQATARETET